MLARFLRRPRDGTLSTARFREPAALVFDSAGNLFVADECHPQDHICRRCLHAAGSSVNPAGPSTGRAAKRAS
jgi:hypothetical protein